MARAPRLTINLDADEKKRLERLAAEYERSAAAQARLAVREHLDRESPRKIGRR